MDANAQITFLPAADLQRSRWFYSDVLRLELVLDQGACLIWRVTESSYVGICERQSVETTKDVILTLVADDVDGWCNRIIDAGGTIDRGPEHSDRYGIYHAFLTDPDGNVVEIQRFDDPNWDSGN